MPASCGSWGRRDHCMQGRQTGCACAPLRSSSQSRTGTCWRAPQEEVACQVMKVRVLRKERVVAPARPAATTAESQCGGRSPKRPTSHQRGPQRACWHSSRLKGWRCSQQAAQQLSAVGAARFGFKQASQPRRQWRRCAGRH